MLKTDQESLIQTSFVKKDSIGNKFRNIYRKIPVSESVF